jgi:hypothetical protein
MSEQVADPVRLRVLQEFEITPRVPVAMPRTLEDGSPYVVPTWCTMSPDEHMCVWGCMSLLVGYVKERGRNHCSGCDFCNQKIVNGKIKPQDGESAFRMSWRWNQLDRAIEEGNINEVFHRLNCWGTFILSPAIPVKVVDLISELMSGDVDRSAKCIDILCRALTIQLGRPIIRRVKP